MSDTENNAATAQCEAYSTSLDFPAEGREFAFHGCKVDVSSITKAGLLYLLRLGFTTSLTQCNAGVASAGKEEGLKPEQISAKLVANREERLQKICDGTIGTRAAGTAPRGKTLDEKILNDLAWSALTVIYSRNGTKLPTGASRSVAISDYLAKPGVKERLAAQAAAIAAIGEEDFA